jgi:hypothetical protein
MARRTPLHTLACARFGGWCARVVKANVKRTKNTASKPVLIHYFHLGSVVGMLLAVCCRDICLHRHLALLHISEPLPATCWPASSSFCPLQTALTNEWLLRRTSEMCNQGTMSRFKADKTELEFGGKLLL